MTPTDAQIEIAAKAAYRNLWMSGAAKPRWDELPQSHKDRLYEAQRAALIAAAELVGAEQHDAQFDRYVTVGEAVKQQFDRYVTIGEAVKQQTIERCAQVVDQLGDIALHDWERNIYNRAATAIRALKDET
jgi:hypothetical protein